MRSLRFCARRWRTEDSEAALDATPAYFVPCTRSGIQGGYSVPVVDKGWIVTAKICEKVLVSRTRAATTFREFVDVLSGKYRRANIVFFPDDWSGLLDGNTAMWENLTSEEAGNLSIVLGGIKGFVVWTSRRGT